MNDSAGYNVILLAAGNSARMGMDKALLPAGNGLSFAGNLAGKYREAGAGKILLLVNHRLDQSKLLPGNIETVVNHQPELGRGWSVQLGLRNLPEGSCCFIHNIDNPFLETGLVISLLAACESGNYVSPVYGGRGGHPVLIGPEIADHIREMDHTPDFREILSQFPVTEVPYSDPGILWNINTPEEYAKYLAKL